MDDLRGTGDDLLHAESLAKVVIRKLLNAVFTLVVDRVFRGECFEGWCMSRVLAVAFSFMIFALLVTRFASAQSLCGGTDVWANGTPGLLRFTARRHARDAWSARAQGDLGQAYATWSRAKDRRLTCVRAQQQRQRQYTCTASARPCRAS